MGNVNLKVNNVSKFNYSNSSGKNNGNTDEYKYSYNDNNEGAINVNMDRSVFDEKPFLTSWYYLSLQNWIRVLAFSVLRELSPKKLIRY